MATSNICNYQPIQSISTKAIDNRFGRVHTALCYLYSQVGGGTVTGASEGLSLSSTNAVFGQAIGEVGNPAALNVDREIPMQNHIIFLTDTGNETSLSSSAISISSSNGDNLISLNANGETSITLRDFVANEPYLMFGVTDSTHNLFMFNNDGVLNVGANLSENFFSYDSTIGTFSVINNIPDLTSSMEVFVVSSNANTDTTGGNQVMVAGTFINETTIGAGANSLTNVGLQVSANQGDFNYAALFTAGLVGINLSTPTARLHIAGGSASAGTAPLKLDSGTNNTIAETGALEYNGTNLFFTRTGTTRESVLTGNSGASAPATAAADSSEINSRYGASTSPMLGDPDSWLSVNIGGSTFKIPLYT